jgi:hypothetical protein
MNWEACKGCDEYKTCPMDENAARKCGNMGCPKLREEIIEIVCEKCGGKTFNVRHIYWVFSGHQMEHDELTCTACGHMQ